MAKKINRRQAVLGVSSALLLPATARTLTSRDSNRQDRNTGFLHGIASGDPDHSSVVLWTRITTTAGVAEGFYEVSSSRKFSDIAHSGTFKTDATRDYTVKVLVRNLRPGRHYYYRFSYNGFQSPVGRTKTLPVGQIEHLGIALASCSNYPFGYFNAYEAIANDPAIDIVLHLGDYIYEYGPDGYGGATGKQLGRGHEPRKEIVTLEDYRTRHAQYKSDLDSQTMHAVHPLIAIWDDHEVTNNPWMHGAENHQPDQEGPWKQRKEAALQAYFEWMPVRNPDNASERASYWRHFEFGDLASLTTLETRHTGRAKQVDYSEHLRQINSSVDAKDFRKSVLGASGRPMLSNDMELFLSKNLLTGLEDNRRWHLIGNQIPMARTHAPPLNRSDFMNSQDNYSKSEANWLSHLLTLGELDLPISLDTWDGYPRARERFYQSCSRAGINDLLVLTGDTHAFWQNELFDSAGNSMGLEIGTSGITSPYWEFSDEKRAKLMDRRISEHNKEIRWTDGRHNGYVRLQLMPDSGRVDYMYVTNILTKDYEVEVLRSLEIGREDKTLRYA